MTFIGIDPGVSGGIAMIEDDGVVSVVHRMPETDADVYLALCDRFVTPSTVAKAVLERVSASPQMGVTSAFTFGKGYGGLRMALSAAGIPFDEVTPQRWQKAMQCLTGGNKNISKARAQQLFPSVKVTHYVADALILAEYCRRFHLGLIKG